jgi:glucosamine-6-phosphate deaminase
MPLLNLPVKVFPDADALGAAIARRILDGLTAGRPYLLGCPGGRTVVSTYRALGELTAREGHDLSGMVIVMMDEYLFPAGDGYRYCPAEAHYSCHRFAEEEIRAVLNAGLPPARRIPPAQVWFPDPADPAAYDARLRAAGGIDLFLIASGAGDGHVAFNPPSSAADSPTRVIPLPVSTRTDNMVTFPAFAHLDEVPSFGVSVGLGTIAGLSREVYLLLHGADKRTAARRVTAVHDYDPAWPATIIHRCHGARVLLDTAAAVALKES